jgi:hypothetical protein
MVSQLECAAHFRWTRWASFGDLPTSKRLKVERITSPSRTYVRIYERGRKQPPQECVRCGTTDGRLRVALKASANPWSLARDRCGCWFSDDLNDTDLYLVSSFRGRARAAFACSARALLRSDPL